jgi:hypothetical protein
MNNCFCQNPSKQLKIVIIRHGEKPPQGDNLSCQGLNRSLQLTNVLHAKFGVPSYVYVPSLSLGKSTSKARMYQTIVPFAAKYNLAINTKFDESDAKGIAQTVISKSGTVLLVWEHKEILEIVKKLGVNDKNLSWDDNDYDSIWIVTFTNGKPSITRDHENIKPANDCR